MEFKRTLSLTKFNEPANEYYGLSAFIFGPRMTGKTSLLQDLSPRYYFDLLIPNEERKYRAQPELFWHELQAIKNPSLVIVDEIQRLPELLDYVQLAITKMSHWFLLSGSSARKLKRGGANLLGGRALDLKLHPLTHQELGEHFRLNAVIQFGSLPKISQLLIDKRLNVAKGMLRAYVTTYIQQEVKAEALVRDLAGFERFLPVAASCHGQMIEYSTIARECSVKAAVVKEYFSILEDTLIGRFLWPFDRSERKKSRPKFYFFDCGVLRAIQNRLNDPPSSLEIGFLFEGWFIEELHRLRDYHNLECEFSLWRQEKDEIDLIISKGRKPILAFELKSGRKKPKVHCLKKFKSLYPEAKVFVVNMIEEKPRAIAPEILLISFHDALGEFLGI